MRNRLIYLLIFLFTFLSKINSQNIPCNVALYNLQNYAHQVNYMYSSYYTNIAYGSCGYNWQTCLYNLNGWYYNQCVMVNNWYIQLYNQCAYTPSQSPSRRPAPRNRGNDRMSDIDEEDLNDLADEINPNKSTRINIPDNPVGWQ
jgi:hypothetical protein